MYLSDRDLEHAVLGGHLIVNPPPTLYDTTGIDLHLDTIEEARVWDVDRFQRDQERASRTSALAIGKIKYKEFAAQIPLAHPARRRRSGETRLS